MVINIQIVSNKNGEVTPVSANRTVLPSMDSAYILRPLQKPLPVWIAVGGTPASVMRAGTLGLLLALAIIGGQLARFTPLVNLYRDAARRSGHDAATLPMGINSHGYIADTSQEARDEHDPFYTAMMNRLDQSVAGPV